MSKDDLKNIGGVLVYLNEPVRAVRTVMRVPGLGLGDGLLAVNSAVWFARHCPEVRLVLSLPRACVDLLSGFEFPENLIVEPIDIPNESDRVSCYARYADSLIELYDFYNVDCVLWSFACSGNGLLAHAQQKGGYRVGVEPPYDEPWQPRRFSAYILKQTGFACDHERLHAGVLYGALPFFPLLPSEEAHDLFRLIETNHLPYIKNNQVAVKPNMIVLCPFASTPEKSLSDELLLAALQGVILEYDHVIISVASSGVANKVQSFLDMNRFSCTVVVIHSDIRQVKSLLCSAGAVLSVDTGLVHLAASCVSEETRTSVLMSNLKNTDLWGYSRRNIDYFTLDRQGVLNSLFFLKNGNSNLSRTGRHNNQYA